MKTKSLFIAICLLVVSATMLGTASFAWFSMNTEVAVDGIEVEAYSDSLFLEIAKENAEDAFDVTTNLSRTPITPLKLVTPINAANAIYVTATEATATAPYYSAAEFSGVVLYKMGDTKADANSALNYVIATDLEEADDLSSYCAVVISAPSLTTAQAGVTYCRLNSAKTGYTVVSFDTGATLPYDVRTLTVKTYYTKDTDKYEPAATRIEGASLEGLYDVTFAATVPGTTADGVTEYYTESAGVYTKATVTTGDSVDGYYTVAGETLLAASDKAPALYTYNGVNEYVLVTEDLSLGTDLTGYYTVAEGSAVSFGAVTADVYVKDGNNNYVCIYDYTGAGATEPVNLSDRLFWGRTYSNTLGAVEATNTLSALKAENLDNVYYRKETVYLRCAENTNAGTNLKLAEVTVGGRVNDLSAALRIKFIATNGAGETVELLYNNGTKTTSGNGELFASIAGNRAEVVTVDMYLYFDGTAEVAKTLKDSDAGILNGHTVELKFTIAENTNDQS